MNRVHQRAVYVSCGCICCGFSSLHLAVCHPTCCSINSSQHTRSPIMVVLPGRPLNQPHAYAGSARHLVSRGSSTCMQFTSTCPRQGCNCLGRLVLACWGFMGRLQLVGGLLVCLAAVLTYCTSSVPLLLLVCRLSASAC